MNAKKNKILYINRIYEEIIKENIEYEHKSFAFVMMTSSLFSIRFSLDCNNAQCFLL